MTYGNENVHEEYDLGPLSVKVLNVFRGGLVDKTSHRWYFGVHLQILGTTWYGWEAHVVLPDDVDEETARRTIGFEAAEMLINRLGEGSQALDQLDRLAGRD